MGKTIEETISEVLFDGHNLVGTAQSQVQMLSVEEWTEIGVETKEDGLSFCLVINRDTDNFRITNGEPAFKALLHYFAVLKHFNWKPLVNIRLYPDAGYAVCWHRSLRYRAPAHLQHGLG